MSHILFSRTSYGGLGTVIGTLNAQFTSMLTARYLYRPVSRIFFVIQKSYMSVSIDKKSMFILSIWCSLGILVEQFHDVALVKKFFVEVNFTSPRCRRP